MGIYRIIFLLALFFWPPWAEAKTIEGKVVKVFDGDTLLVRIEGRDEHVRLREIDAPEVTNRKRAGQEPWGGRSKQFAQSLLKGKTVRLEIEARDARDKYQRLLAYVFTDAILINKEIVRSGNALFYPSFSRGKYATELEMAEKEAKEKGLGIWDKRNGLKERPSEFRQRLHRDESLFSKFTRLVRSPQEKPSFQEYAVPDGKIVGNKRSMLYHMAGSISSKRVSPKNRAYFDSPEEAEKAGFRPAHKAVISDR